MLQSFCAEMIDQLLSLRKPVWRTSSRYYHIIFRHMQKVTSLFDCGAGVGLLYRQALLEAFPGVEDGMRSLGDRLRGRQRSSLYQVCSVTVYPCRR